VIAARGSVHEEIRAISSVRLGRELLRRAIVGILSEAPPDDPSAREYRRRLATALY